jgi:hypothetical protein
MTARRCNTDKNGTGWPDTYLKKVTKSQQVLLAKNGYLTRQPTFDFHRQQNLRLADQSSYFHRFLSSLGFDRWMKLTSFIRDR